MISGQLLEPEINVLSEFLNISTQNPIAFIVKEYLRNPEVEDLKKKRDLQMYNARIHLLKTRGYVDYTLIIPEIVHLHEPPENEDYREKYDSTHEEDLQMFLYEKQIFGKI